MRYPTLSLSVVEEIALKRLDSEVDIPVRHLVAMRGADDDFDEAQLEQVLEVFRSAREDPRYEEWDEDRIEGLVAGALHSALKDLPIEVLDDPGFWRFIGMEHLWAFVQYREDLSVENVLKYVDGRNPTECVVTRMFLRAASVVEEGDYSLAHALPKATDFWRSHVLRVRTSGAPPVARAFAKRQRDKRAKTTALRDNARRLNRMWTNVVLDFYDEEEAAELLDEIFIGSETE